MALIASICDKRGRALAYVSDDGSLAATAAARPVPRAVTLIWRRRPRTVKALGGREIAPGVMGSASFTARLRSDPSLYIEGVAPYIRDGGFLIGPPP